ncbi:MAG: carbohydrate kinase family protein [candidate division WWE3 bacterium]|nr:carbohydrate kinase family protein [candidate division WWE3 bacterium]
MYEVITIGGATQDIFFIDEDFPVKNDALSIEWGEKFLVRKCLITFGGGAANCAVGLSRLGIKTAFWGQIGDDLPGAEIAKNFKQEKVSLQFLEITGKVHSSVSSILVGQGGEHAIIMYRGTNDDLEIEAEALSIELTNTKFFYLADAGSTSEALTTEVLKLVKFHNVRLAFVPGQNQLKLGINKLAPILQETDLFVLNVYEAYELLDLKYQKTELNTCATIEEDVKKALKKFYDLGAKKVIITRDVCGSQAYDGKTFYSEPSPAILEYIDTTGAGDAFATGALAALLRGHGLATALKWGNLESASVIGVYGAQPGLLSNI